MGTPFEQVIIGPDDDQLDGIQLSLLETLDHVLNRGLVIAGEITISVADIDLIFVGLNVLVSSVEKAQEVLRTRAQATLSEADSRDLQPEGQRSEA
jgi:gas vesicle protein GvpA/GvpJ/GvpM family